MKLLFLACAAVAGTFAGATVMGNAMAQFVDGSREEQLAEYCQAGVGSACEELVRVTNGQCAGPEWSACTYNLKVIK